MGWNQTMRRVATATMLSSVLMLGACGVSAMDADEGNTSTSALVETSTVVLDETGSSAEVAQTSTDASASNASGVPTKDALQVTETIADESAGGHAIEADGTQDSYANVAVQKTGDSDSGDEADFYGDNAAVFATNGATLDLSQIVVETDGTHANGVFSYGEGTTVNISDSVIETSGNCSGGLMTTGGGTMNASNLSISTLGNSSAAIRSDRGGGTVNVDGGVYTTSGTGSPVIYSTADITVSDAVLTSTASEGVVVEGKNSVTLKDVDLTADNNTKNSDKSDNYKAVMIYQSMSGDAEQGAASFAMEGGSLTNVNGDVFFVNNTITTISLNDVLIANQDAEGAFLRAAAAGWGNEGSNGGQVELKATDQQIDGNMVVDEISKLNLYLDGKSAFTGTINADGAAGEVYVEVSEGSTWTLTGDSYITSLTCAADAIDLNGYTLYVDGKAYEAGTASTGDAVEFDTSSSSGGPGEGGMPPEGGPGEGGMPPEGAPDGGPGGPGDGEEPPAKPGE